MSGLLVQSSVMRLLVFVLVLCLNPSWAHTNHASHGNMSSSTGFKYTRAPDSTLLATMKTQVRALMDANKQNHGTVVEFIPRYVRLVFHDCVGGCDGCINLNNEGNRGLNHLMALDKLNQVYDTYFNNTMSRADFWVNAATAGLEYAMELAASNSSSGTHAHRRRLSHATHSHAPSFAYTWGRQDCATSPTTTVMRTFPSSIGNTHAVLHFFQMEFNLTTKETVALMGAHTLGRAVTAHTGFSGPWASRTDALDNAYYRNLLNMMWVQGPPPPDSTTGHAHRRALRTHNHNHGMTSTANVTKFQWNNPHNNTMMLNADMALIRMFMPDMMTGKVNCTFKGSSACANATSTMGFVEMYANNNMMWLTDFAAVWAKITAKGAAQLYPVTANSSLPSACIGTSLCQTTTAAPSGTNDAPRVIPTMLYFVLGLVSVFHLL